MNAIDVVVEVIDALERTGIPYMLVGSFSSNLYGIPRMTKDADFVLQLGPTSIRQLVQALGPAYRLDPQVSFETVTSTVRHQMEHAATGFTIEFFELSDDPHDRERFARRRQGVFAGRRILVPTPEDVIITKLRWSQAGNRRKDIDDVESVISVQRQYLDLPYMRRWCDAHGTRGLLEKLLA